MKPSSCWWAGCSATAAKERLHHLCSVLSKPFEMDELLQLVRECASR